MTVLTRSRLYRCGICTKRITANESVYSRVSRTHYCRDLDACVRRNKRNNRKRVAS